MVNGWHAYLSDSARPWASPTITVFYAVYFRKKAKKHKAVSFFREQSISKKEKNTLD